MQGLECQECCAIVEELRAAFMAAASSNPDCEGNWRQFIAILSNRRDEGIFGIPSMHRDVTDALVKLFDHGEETGDSPFPNQKA
jgi:hypothetical protein